MLETSLRLIREYNPCIATYKNFRTVLGVEWGDDTPITLKKILELSGLDDALWALRAVRKDQAKERDQCIQSFVFRCTRETPLSDVTAVIDLIEDTVWEVSENAVGNADAVRASEIAARIAVWAAENAAWTARDAAGAAAKDATWTDWEAAKAEAWDAAWNTARNAQERIFIEVLTRKEAEND